ncbi:hypothetical protein [Ralstonia pickettii]|jgi:hypothetical protein|uniref:hypothetical protein n=1 Tax=Ralstonia pickettii TaxID=329 RepID=UPI0004691662|nr:hypothetical protein [Ralstonia pickettii]MBA9869552.1 hypothetical protein [Ralstonia insidiosa]
MSASRENLLRVQQQRDAVRAACKAGGIQNDVRLAAADAAYKEAERQYREIQRGKIVAGVCFAAACGAVGLALGLPAWGVAAIFLGGVGVVKLLTI